MFETRCRPRVLTRCFMDSAGWGHPAFTGSYFELLSSTTRNRVPPPVPEAVAGV